jgi:hypothetical protein
MPIKAIAHVKGHQDKNIPKHKLLSWQAKLNIKADKLASFALTNAHLDGGSMEVSHNPVRLMDGDEIVTAHEVEMLRWRWREFELQTYYAQKYHLRINKLPTINWAALQLARKQIPSHLIPFSVKLMIQWLPVGTRMAKYGNEITMCHFCNDEEDFNHVFCCKGKVTQHTALKMELTTKLRQLDTKPEIQMAFTFWINAWITGTTTQEPSWSTEIGLDRLYHHNVILSPIILYIVMLLLYRVSAWMLSSYN